MCGKILKGETAVVGENLALLSLCQKQNSYILPTIEAGPLK